LIERKIVAKAAESISQAFYELLLRQYSCTKKLQSQTVIREKHRKALLFNKGTLKCWCN